MACPYTFDDVLRAKKFHPSVLRDDFKKLVDFKADTNPKKWCGNKILYHYQFKNLLNCKRDKKNYKSLQEMFENPDDLQKLWDDTIKRNRRKKGIDSILAIDIYEAYRINKGAIVFFKPSTSKYIYKLFNARSVLDPTAGWGGRMLGAMSLGIAYTGIDTNVNLKPGYDEMMSQFNPEKNVRMIWEDALKVDYSKFTYDLVLTSPPYVNMEIYEHCPLFNPKTFYKEWLIPLMDKVFEHLQEGGHMCFNISPKMFKDLMKAGYKPPDDKIDLRQQMGQNSQVKSQDYIYVWNKSVTNLKTEIVESSNTNTMEAPQQMTSSSFMDMITNVTGMSNEYIDRLIELEAENNRLKEENIALRKCKNKIRSEMGQVIHKIRQELTALEKTSEE
jgi:hypothetical protein